MPQQKCPVCGQALLDPKAHARVQANLSKFLEHEKAKLGREAKREAQALALRQVEALRGQHAEELARATSQAAAASRTQLRENEQLKKKVAELQRRLEKQTPDQRGEFGEAEILTQLQTAFPTDEIRRLNKRQGGADILHEVREKGAMCGVIAYECKNVAAWSNGFIGQVRKARTVHKARYVVLVSNMFPRGQKHLCVVRDVPVVHPSIAVHLARYLREAIVTLAQSRATEPERQRRADRLLQLIQSEEFGEQMHAIAEAVQDLEGLQDKERQDHERTWARQSEYLAVISKNTTRLDGQIAAILHAPVARDTGARPPLARSRALALPAKVAARRA
ncbi:DUF2130 domain-containing protein [Polyangium mundeleinium]|uniref:DUF2130 domain-containing protein n=1 Tax=Polyangium mundeleinium TaxID=2995306 RepID=A0ABT5EHN6_9BACT|nr:DUF2130 domain-containing protein [Polyangium mundeleinium]MDC0740887.1 DUF2130 domain-containing protein [Polyangium mundeleinium]